MLRIPNGGLSALLLLVVIAFAAPALATSYVMVADEDLVDGADLIAHVRITGIETVDTDRGIVTEFLAESRRIVKGTAPEVLRLRVPGGELADGRRLVVFGMPAFGVGEEAVVFLEPEVGGAREFKHYLLGAFHVADADGRPIAYRSVPAGNLLLDHPERAHRAASLRLAHLPRDLAGFLDWAAARSEAPRPAVSERVVEAPGSYYLDESVLDRVVRPDFSLFESAGDNFHRHEFSPGVGGSVEYVYNKRIKKASRGGVKAVQDTVKSMSKIFNIDVDYGGRQRKARAGLTKTDGNNAILTGDRNKEIAGAFSCSTGGVLAIGGVAAGGIVGPVHQASASGKKRTYWDIIESDVVVQNGIECVRSGLGSKKLWDAFLGELLGHEIYHSFGVGHSCGDSSTPACGRKVLDEAIMRASIHGDGRGAQFNRDDKKAAKALDYKG